MQVRIDKIDKLIQAGYTLNKTAYGFIDFRNSTGKSVQVFGGLFRRSPVGFSWIAFFFPAFVCTQIREWSYFYVAGTYFIMVSISQAILGAGSTFLGFGICIVYGYMFPYLRRLSSDFGTIDMPRWRAIVIGLFLSVACAIPSLIIDIIFGS